MLHNTLQPVHSISNSLRGLGDTQSYCPAPGSCDGDCVPFCCFNGGDLTVFTAAGKGAEYVMQVANIAASVVIAAILVSASAVFGPAGAILAGVYAILQPLTNWLNTTINEKRLQAEQIVIQEESLRATAFGIQAAIECRLPWCDRIAEMQKWPVFASNSITFGEAGPEVGMHCIGAYMGLAEQVHISRIDKTNQQIITTQGSAPGIWRDKQDYYQLYDGKLMIRVPNIEHYWMHDKVIINGDTSKIYSVVHRYGKSGKITWDCDNTFVDRRIIPDYLLTGSGRGCKVAFSASYNGSASSGGGGKQGYNLRTMTGPGWLVTNKKYIKSEADTFIGGTVDLYRKTYMIPTGPGGSSTAGTESWLTKLIPLNAAQLASFLGNKNMLMQGAMVALLAGAGVFMLTKGMNPKNQSL